MNSEWNLIKKGTIAIHEYEINKRVIVKILFTSKLIIKNKDKVIS